MKKLAYELGKMAFRGFNPMMMGINYNSPVMMGGNDPMMAYLMSKSMENDFGKLFKKESPKQSETKFAYELGRKMASFGPTTYKKLVGYDEAGQEYPLAYGAMSDMSGHRVSMPQSYLQSIRDKIVRQEMLDSDEAGYNAFQRLRMKHRGVPEELLNRYYGQQ